MSIKLSFPTAASPTDEVVLADGLEVLPFSRPRRKYQSAFDTDSGAQLVYDWGSEIRAFSVALEPLTTAEVASLETFYATTVNGREQSWQYTDGLGDVYTVRFAQDAFEPVMISPTIWRLEFNLRTTS